MAGCGESVRLQPETSLRFGVMTDLHYADRNSAGSRYYTLSAMCVGPFPENNVYAVVEVLGDKMIVTGHRAAKSVYRFDQQELTPQF